MLLALLHLLAAAGPEGLPVVAIDPGHGGTQRGATGACGALEKDVALDIALELARLLEATGRARVVLTRQDDTTLDLEQRSRVANDAGAWLFLSIHANAGSNPESSGVETFYLSRRAADARIEKLSRRENEGRKLPAVVEDDALAVVLGGLLLNAAHQESRRLALRVQQSMQQSVEAHGRGVLQAPFLVLLGAQMPAVLVEVGYLTNRYECELLADEEHRRTVAAALGAALLAHLSSDSPAAARP